MNGDRFLELATGQAGTIVLALGILYAFIKGWVVPGWLYRRENARADRLESLALKSTSVAERVVKVAEKDSP